MKPTCRIMIALCLPLLFCGPAWGLHIGPYAGAYVGGNALVNTKSSGDLGSFNLEYNPALLGSAVIGWDLEPGNPVGEGRVELEYTRRSNRLDQVEFSNGKFKGDGSLTVDSILLNSFAVFRGNSQWSPYVGIGLGAARIAADGLTVTGQPLIDDKTVVFAYQLGGGVDFALTDSLTLDLGYRFFGVSSPKFTESNGLKFETDYFSHNVVLGLRVGF